MKTATQLPYDQRLDLGYGRTKSKFHTPRSGPASFPYTEPASDLGDEEELPYEDGTNPVRAKIPTANYHTSDHYAGTGTNPFYFAAGNTKLSDCFVRPDDVLAEIESTGKSMTSVPGMYRGKGKNFSRGGHSAKYITTQSYRRTGDLYGWSKPILDPEEENEEPIYTLADLLDVAHGEG